MSDSRPTATHPAPETARATAEALLARDSGAPVRLGPATVLRRTPWSQVLRYPVTSGPSAIGESVIVKAFGTAENPCRLGDPVYGSPGQRYHSERRGLDLLTRLAAAEPIAPRLLAADDASAMVIMEDLGDGPSLAGALQGDDPLAAELALVAYAEALGRMHAATIGIEPDRYRSVTWDLTSLVAAGEKVRGALASVDVTPPPGVDADLAEVDALLSDPSFRCLTHGDPCPDNTRLRDGRLLLFDFEDAGTRHAVLDCVFLHLPFPSCWCWAQIPEAVVHKARDAHRATLAPACPAILDDGVYLRAIAAAAAAWVVVHLQYSLPGAIEADRSWGLATTRLRLVTWLDVLAATTAEAAAFPALHTLAVDLAARLRHLWPDLPPVDPYPPFRP